MSTSVVVVTYQTGEVLFSCLASVLDQPGLDRVVVVDNGNPEAVRERLRRFAAQPNVDLVAGQGNVGFATACNLGAERVESEFVLFLNPDCIAAPGAIAALTAEARRLPDPFVVTPRLVNPDGSDQRGARRDVLTPWRALVEALRLDRLAPNHPYFKRFNQHDEPLPEQTAPVNVTSGACMLMRLDTFQNLGGFDTRYFLHVEDIDLCVSVLRGGGSPYFCPAITFVHYGRSSNVSRIFVEWHKCRSFRHYFRKNFKIEYPAGFVTLVNLLVALRFAALLPVFVALDLARRHRTPRRLDGERAIN